MTEHLSIKASYYPAHLKDFMFVDNDGFALRYKRQIMLLHIAAYYLVPDKRTTSISENFDSQLQDFFHQYTACDADYETLSYEFEAFRAQESSFESECRC